MKKRYDKNAGRRGIGIELALLVLMVVFGLSALLVSTAMLEKNNLENLSQRVELEQLADNFCADPENWALPEESIYAASISDDRCTLELSLDGEVLLTVVLEASGNAYKVVQWTYH